MKVRRPAIFLDRDGTLIHDRPGFYLRKLEQLRIYPFAFEALRRLKRAGYRLVVISNQSGVGRGYLSAATLEKIHRRLRSQLRLRGAALDGIYVCPHAPNALCRCRKPSPLLARRAARELGLRWGRSCVIGDKKADVDLARALGLPCVHVATGHGRRERLRHRGALRATHYAGNLAAAANWILRELGSEGARPGEGES